MGDKKDLERLLLEVDRSLDGTKTFDFYVIGGSAMALHWGVDVSTQDLDVLRRYGDDELEGLIRKFDRDSEVAKRLGVFVDGVEPAFPPMPMGWQKRATQVEGPWRCLRVWRVEIHDLLISKIKRFRLKDRNDITILIRAHAAAAISVETLRLRFSQILAPPEEMDDNLETVIEYLEGKRTSL